jgi:hypothetical protein
MYYTVPFRSKCTPRKHVIDADSSPSGVIPPATSLLLAIGNSQIPTNPSTYHLFFVIIRIYDLYFTMATKSFRDLLGVKPSTASTSDSALIIIDAQVDNPSISGSCIESNGQRE